MQLYQTLILSILLYGAQSWAVKKDDENTLHVFGMTCLSRILGVSRLEKISNTKIKESLNLDQDVLNRTETKKLKYFGHVKRMQPTRYPKVVMGGNVKGRRPKGRSPKRWLDCISQDSKTRSITSLTEASRLATDRSTCLTVTIQQIQEPSRGPLAT